MKKFILGLDFTLVLSFACFGQVSTTNLGSNKINRAGSDYDENNYKDIVIIQETDVGAKISNYYEGEGFDFYYSGRYDFSGYKIPEAVRFCLTKNQNVHLNFTKNFAPNTVMHTSNGDGLFVLNLGKNTDKSLGLLFPIVSEYFSIFLMKKRVVDLL